MAAYRTLVKKVSLEHKIKQKDYKECGALPIIDQGINLIGGYTDDLSQKVDCNLPVIVFGDHTRRVKLINFPFAAGADGIKILQPSTNIDARYLYYETQYLTYKIKNRGYARHYQYIEKEEVIVPELSEQSRIVTRIEELFSELDKAIDTLKTTKEQLAVYRQAVLKDAFSGLSETVKMDKIADMIDPQPSHRTPPEYKNGIPYIGIGDIDYQNKKINFEDARKVSPEVLDEHLRRYTVHKGDFVMGKIGTIGKPYKIPDEQNYALSANVILIQPNKEKIYPEFLFWQFSSPLITKQLTLGAKATSQPAFGIKKARLLSIKICALEKQFRIVKKLEAEMSCCDNIEKTVDSALAQADAMRQSILKQAFEGTL